MSNSVIVTFIRHAQSTDNNRAMWTGWKDAPLSYNGVNQARTLGESLADTHFTAIYTSDLQRASATAQALYDHQKDPKPSFDSSDLFREQNVGLAVGKPMSFDVISPILSWEEHAARGVYLACYSDDGRFLGGESIKGMAERARTGLEQFVFPHVWQAAKGETGVHVAVVSHGLCITELVSELFKKSAKQVKKPEDISLSNTGWIRVVVDIEGVQEGQPIDVDKERPALAMRITQVEGRHYGY